MPSSCPTSASSRCSGSSCACCRVSASFWAACSASCPLIVNLSKRTICLPRNCLQVVVSCTNCPDFSRAGQSYRDIRAMQGNSAFAGAALPARQPAFLTRFRSEAAQTGMDTRRATGGFRRRT